MSNANLVRLKPVPEARRIVIEKGVPLPALRRAGRKSKYPFAEMEPGDSFFVKDVKASSLHTSALCFAKRHQPAWKFVTRKVEGGTHIWRVK